MSNFAAKRLKAQVLMVNWSVCLLVLMVFLTSCESNRDSQVSTTPPPAPVAIPVTTPQDVPRHDSVVLNESLKLERVRTECIDGRRRLCGLVLQVDDGGLVVDSGYTDLLRPDLLHSWVVPSTVTASRPANLVEENSPGSVCVGLIYVTALPKRPTVKQYDYVVLQAYPAGQYTYAPVQNVKRNLRKFSVDLETAIQLNMGTAQ